MKTTLILSAGIVLTLVIAIMVVGNRVSDEIIPLRDAGGVGWYLDEYGKLDPAVKSDVEKWPELFELAVKKKGYSSFDSYMKSDKKKYPLEKFRNEIPALVKANAEQATKLSPPVSVYMRWKDSSFASNSWYSEKWFRYTFDLQNPVKWYLWKIYVLIYSA